MSGGHAAAGIARRRRRRGGVVCSAMDMWPPARPAMSFYSLYINESGSPESAGRLA